MNNHLQAENDLLRQQLEALLYEARQNEYKMSRFDQFQHQMISASSHQELIHLLLSEYRRMFDLEFVSLALVDREYEIFQALGNGLGNNAACGGLILLPSPETLAALYGGKHEPYLGAFEPLRHQALFNAPPGAIVSVALLPLTRHGELIGSLHSGSADPERYSASCGTAFLVRLAETIAICLENTLSQERLKRLGLTDALTGVPNRRYFDHRCLIEISQARRHKQPLACMFLDIDKFKGINDTYGHQAGDEVLMSVANLIQSQLRVGDTIARYGGEEFVVLLPQTDMPPASQIAERIRGCIAEKNLYANSRYANSGHGNSGHSINLTISIGISMLLFEDSTADNQQLADRMVAAADKALYQAKQGGRNRVICGGVA